MIVSPLPVPQLRYPVQTLEGELLLPAGTKVTREVLQELIARDRSGPFPEVPLLDFDTVRSDLLEGLRAGPYQVIFQGPQSIANLLGYMEHARMVRPLLAYLKYFKQVDPYTYGHILRVFSLTTLLAQTLLEDGPGPRREIMAGPVHDLGKICVPLEILRKSDPLTRTERGVLEHHAAAGYVLLGYYMKDPDSFLAKGALEHHERRDGSGYPLGLPLRDPMVEILAASDVYDALISPRPYREAAYENRTALEEMVRMAERGALGWDVVKALVACNRRSKPSYKECVVSREVRGTPPRGNAHGVLVEEDDS
jgi:HD-GYP domain-containing protein (c-di-GMP phosphodiesterase class II)